MINAFEQEQKRRLYAMRGRLGAEINQMREAIQEKSAPTGEHAHGAPSDSIDNEIHLEQAEKGMLLAVNAALERIDHHAYGICEDCGKRILRSRLAAVPYAQRCLECQRSYEANHED